MLIRYSPTQLCEACNNNSIQLHLYSLCYNPRPSPAQGSTHILTPPPPKPGPGSRGTHHREVLEPAELRAAVSPTQLEEEEQGDNDGGDDEGRHQAGQQRVQLRGLVKHGRCDTKTHTRGHVTPAATQDSCLINGGTSASQTGSKCNRS